MTRLVDADGTGSGGASPPMDCVDVRDRLTEYTLSLLPAAELESVERHLAWCAGCRKEASELAGGAAAAALALPQADPPPELEEKVVRRIRSAAGAPGRRGRTGRRIAIVLAAVLAVFMGFQWAATEAKLQSAREASAISKQVAERVAARFTALSKQLLGGRRHPHPGDSIRSIPLSPEPDRNGGGQAMVFTSRHQEDWVLVVLGGLAPKDQPYGVTVQSPTGDVLSVGTLPRLDRGGGGYLWRSYAGDLAPYSRVVVTDAAGHVVMTGLASNESPAPTTGSASS